MTAVMLSLPPRSLASSMSAWRRGVAVVLDEVRRELLGVSSM